MIFDVAFIMHCKYVGKTIVHSIEKPTTKKVQLSLNNLHSFSQIKKRGNQIYTIHSPSHVISSDMSNGNGVLVAHTTTHAIEPSEDELEVASKKNYLEHGESTLNKGMKSILPLLITYKKV